MASKATKSTKKKPAPKAKPRSPANKGNAKPPVNPLRTIARAEVIGVALVLVALFTLLSLMSSSRGQITEGWISTLRGLFGVGVWLIPLVSGALGLWFIIRAIERMPNMSWQRPVGFGLLFLAFITGAALLLPNGMRDQLTAAGDGGGAVGQATADTLESTLGAWGGWAVVTFLAVVALFLLADRLILDGWYSLTDWWDRRQAPQVDRGPTPPPLKPAVPMPSGKLPFWKRWLRTDHEPDPLQLPRGPNHVQAEPSSPARSDAKTRPVTEPAAAAAPVRAGAPPPADADLLNPRIVGGTQDWKLPQLNAVLNDWERVTDSDDIIRQQGRMIQETLSLFGVPADFEGAYKGPSVTQYLIKPGYVERKVGNETQRVKVKVAKIAALSNDLALALAAPSVRIEAPIPGTNYVGIEVPNQASNVVGLKELMESEAFSEMKGRLKIALGEDVKGQPIVADLARMPHLLIAGATGSGKSVCINSIIADLLLTHTPESLRLLMIDPKMVELSVYNKIPHLLSDVVTEVDKAAAVLFWAVKEMERRYTLFSKASARDLPRYNQFLQKNGEKPLPYIVVIVDEMADLMMAAPEEVEKHVCRLAQMARAVGIHLIIATQRPSVDVITGLIKANFPARIAFAVTSQIDSRVILDVPGAERLLGRGDMLFMAPDASKLERVQGTFLSDDEINKLVRYWKGIRAYEPGQSDLGMPAYPQTPGASGDDDLMRTPFASPSLPPTGTSAPSALSQPPLFEQIEQMKAADARDEFFDEAVRIVQENGRGSVSLLQRRLRIGYGRAARLVDQLEAAGILGPDLGASRGREYVGSSKDSPETDTGAGPTIAASDTDEPNDAPPPRIWM